MTCMFKVIHYSLQMYLKTFIEICIEICIEIYELDPAHFFV